MIRIAGADSILLLSKETELMCCGGPDILSDRMSVDISSDGMTVFGIGKVVIETGKDTL